MRTNHHRFRTLIILLAVAAIGFGVFHFTQWQYQQSLLHAIDSTNTKNYLFTIEKGESVRSIGERLKEKTLINQSLTFYWYIRQNELGPQIKAGRFILKKNYSIPEIASILTKETPQQTVFTIPEGLTIPQIDQKLIEAGLISPGEFTQCTQTCNFNDITFLTNKPSLEGYLFPDTYFIDSADFNIETFIRRLLNNFQQKITPEIEAALKNSNRSLHNFIIMASIIEAEVNTDADRPIISGILWKRLDNSWPLGADATLLYVTDDRIIDAADLELDSPYNTRKNLDLPPTAIGNPGLKSIEAAFFPEESQYWFYLNAAETGEVIYAVSNEEHNANKQTYL